LRAIVDAEKVRSLPTFKPPAVPLIADKAGWFIADIRHGSTIEHVGYFYSEPELTSDPKKQDWHDAQTALKPLSQWFHEIESLALPSSKHDASLCINYPSP
jgi:hypothetical protein